MKINSQDLIPQEHKLSLKTKVSFDFENILNSPSKNTSGGDYYRQHQTHLQQSSLCFEKGIAFAVNASKTTMNQSISPHKTQHVPEKPDVILASHKIKYPIAIAIKEQFNLFLSVLNELNTNLEHWMQANYGLIQSNASNKVLLANCNAPYSNNSSSYKSVSKPFQCHINKNEVELSLNIQGLAIEEKLNLEKLIKKWLKHQNLILKTLLINGEQQ